MPEAITAPSVAAECAQHHRISGPTRFHSFVCALLVACVYFAGTKIGLLLTPADRPVSTLWPPNALLFSALLLTPVEIWPVFVIGVLPAHLFAQLESGIPLLTVLGWYCTNVGEALLAAGCLRAYCASHRITVDKLFKSFRGIVAFVTFGVLLAPMLTSFLDSGLVIATGWGTGFWQLWRDRSLSNMLANLTLVPPIIALSVRWGSLTRDKNRLMEAAAIVACLFLVVGVIFGTRGNDYSIATLIYLLLPIVLWAAVRFGSGGASASLLLVALLSIGNAVRGRGPFGNLADRVLSLQIFISSIGVSTLFLGAVLDERHDLEHRLRRHQDLLALVNQIAVSFSDTPWDRIDYQISRSLSLLCTFLGAERANIYELTADDRLSLRYSANIGQSERNLDGMPFAQLRAVVKEIRVGKGVLVNDVNRLPESLGKGVMANAWIHSIAVVPLGAEDAVKGILSVVSIAEPQWPEDLIPQLQLLGEIFYDSMERKDAFEALAESEHRFRHAADFSPMMVWMSGTDGLCTYFNRAWLEFTGVEVEKQIGEGWTELVHHEDLEHCLKTYKTAFAVRAPFQMEYRIRRNDGEYRWVLDIGVPRSDTHGRFLGFIGSCIDITERRNAQRAVADLSGKLIKAQESERQRLARELHDDVGQRLTLLTMDLASIQQVADLSMQRAMLHLIDEAHLISDCVHNMSHDLHSASVDLLPIGIAIGRLCRDFSLRTKVDLYFHEQSVPEQVPQEIKLCLYRIAQEALQNIRKHSRARRASVEVSGIGTEIILSIKDDGVGFLPNRDAENLGLGLVSMRERVRAVNGVIRLASAPMQGTQVIVSVPLSTPKAAEPGEAA